MLSNIKSGFRALKMYVKSRNLFRNVFDKWSDYLINQAIILLVKFKTNFVTFINWFLKS